MGGGTVAEVFCVCGGVGLNWGGLVGCVGWGAIGFGPIFGGWACLGFHLDHGRLSLPESSMRASKALAKANASMRDGGRLRSSSLWIGVLKPDIKKEIKRDSEIPVTLFINVSNSD